jgi:hypothetical protein
MSTKPWDLHLTVAITTAAYIDAEYVLQVQFRNHSGHGAVLQQFQIRSAQSREGHETIEQPILSVRWPKFEKWGMGHAADERRDRHLPVHVAPNGGEEWLAIWISCPTGAWTARDRFGHLVTTIRYLNSEVAEDKTTTFAILPR